jgi:hypothetical protein
MAQNNRKANIIQQYLVHLSGSCRLLFKIYW